MNTPPVSQLRPVLGLFGATTIVIGATIGTGVFIKPSQIAGGTGGYFGVIIGLWVLCGLVNLCGALAMGELAAMLPQAGGNYIYLREAYGRLWAFLWVWAEFWVMRTGSTAALSVIVADNLVRLTMLPPQIAGGADPPWLKWTVIGAAVTTIAVLAAINVIGTRWGGVVQDITTIIKGGAIVVLAALPFLVGESHTEYLRPLFPGQAGGAYWLSIGSALAGIMWAYDGWGMVTVVAAEVRDPQRNVPRSLFLGLTIIIVLYVLANLAYHVTLPASTIKDLPNTAASVAQKLVGPWGGQALMSVLIVSALGALNSNVLVGPRVLYALAVDHPRLRVLSRIDPRFATPAAAIVGLATWACMLVVAGDLSPYPEKRLFDVLTDFVVFGGSIFYLTAVMAVYLLRAKQPERARPYRTWGYPFTPAVFGVFYVGFLISMLIVAPFESVAGLGFIALGVLGYFTLTWADRRSETTTTDGA